MGVRGTAGSTTTPSRKRETSIFNTPTVVRPPSALSDSSEDGVGKKTANTPIPIKRSQRASGSTVQPHPCHEGGEPNRGFNGCSFAFSCSESFRGRRNSFPTTLCSFAFRLDKPLAFYVNAEACYSPAHGFGLRSCDPGSTEDQDRVERTLQRGFKPYHQRERKSQLLRVRQDPTAEAVRG
jgi:hypothetical protein